MALPADELMLKDMWTDAQNRFQKLTKKSLAQPLTLKDALAAVDKKLNPNDSKDGDKQKKIKAVATDVINFIQLLGGLAAQGASIVFGPASMCFNALQMLLDIPGKISKLYDDLNLLLEEAANFLKQFQIYQRIEQISTLDVEFRQSVHKLLIAFVDVCALSIDFTDRRAFAVFKRTSKLTLFDDDSGVSGALENFRRLSTQHSNISDAVTLERVVLAQNESSGNMKRIWDKLNASAEANSEKFQKLEDGMDTLVKDVNERHDREARLESIKKLGTKLGVTVPTDKKEAPLVQLRSKALQGTGSWLEELESYTQWADLSSGEDQILIISGEPGSGKSVLFSSIFNRLENQYRRSQDRQTRVSMASHVFESGDKALQSGNRGTASQAGKSSTNTSKSCQSIQAFKQLAMQLAADDPVYAKFLTTHLGDRDSVTWKDSEIDQAFKDLFSDATMPDTSGTFYVLFLDSLEQLPREEAKAVFGAISRSDSTRLKVAISAAAEVVKICFDSYPQTFGFHSLSSRAKIQIEEHNSSDITRYLEDEIKHDRVFQSTSADMQTIVTELHDKVPDIVKGNFHDANTILESIRSAVQSESDLDTIISLINSSTLSNTDAACEKAIKELRNGLSGQEVDQLNELLIWTIYGRMYLELRHMRAALFLLMKKSMFQDLEEKVTEKFSRMIRIDDSGYFVMRDSAMEDYFRAMPRIKKLQDDNDFTDEPRISLQINITNARVSQVQRFFWDLSEKIVLDKLERFTFDDPIASRETEKQISAGRLDGQLLLLHRCFDLLLEERKEETTQLAYYATRYWMFHVPTYQSDEDKASYTKTEKQFIVEQLVSLLRNPEYLEAHLTEGFFEEDHMLQEDLFPDIHALLLDPEATGKLRAKERNWANTATQNPPIMILDSVAKMIANQWLCVRVWSSHLPYMWLTTYLNRIGYLMPEEATQEEAAEEAGSDGGGVENEQAENEEVENGETENSENDSDGPSEEVDDDTESEKDAKTESDASSVDEATEPESDGQAEADQTVKSETAVTEVEVDASSTENGTEPQLKQESYDPVGRAIRWVTEEAGMTAKDALWHERLGQTYLHLLEDADSYTGDQINAMRVSAKEAFLSAKSMGGSWQVSQSLAKLYAILHDFEQGLQEMSIAVEQLRNIETRDEDEQDSLVQSLILAAEWQAKLQDSEHAAEKLEEVISLTPESSYGRYELFKLYYDSAQNPQAIALIEKLGGQIRSGSELSELAHLVLHLSSKNQPESFFEELCMATHDSEVFKLLLTAFENAHQSFKEDVNTEAVGLQVAALSLGHGMALSQYATFDGALDQALLRLKESIRIGFDRSDVQRNWTALIASRCFFNCFFSRARIPRDVIAESLDHTSEVRTILHEGCENTWYGQCVRLMLASFYRVAEQQSEAEKLLFQDMQCAFGLLSDNDPANDDAGYTMLGVVLLHAGDELNGLSAFSLRGPKERHLPADEVPEVYEAGKDGLCGLQCDGRCEGYNTWTWESSSWVCKVCDDVQFCTPCLGKLREGTLKRKVCSVDHEWVLMPSWRSEFEETGKTKVRVGGRLPPADGPQQDGHRIDGEIVEISEWLDSVREKWGIPKPSTDTSSESS